MECLRDAGGRRLQHLPRLSAFAHRDAAVLRPARAAADKLSPAHPRRAATPSRTYRVAVPAIPANPHAHSRERASPTPPLTLDRATRGRVQRGSQNGPQWSRSGTHSEVACAPLRSSIGDMNEIAFQRVV